MALFDFHKQERLLYDLSESLKSPPAELVAALEKLQAESKRKDRRIRELSERDAIRQLAALLESAQLESTQHGVLIAQVDVMDTDFLKWMTEQLAQRLGDPHVIALGANIEGKAMFCASVSPTMLEKGIKASDLVKDAATRCEGGGGGKPQFAQAGGKNVANIPAALAALKMTLHAVSV